MYSSTASMRSVMAFSCSALPSSARSALPLTIGMVSPGNSYLVKKLSNLHLH